MQEKRSEAVWRSSSCSLRPLPRSSTGLGTSAEPTHRRADQHRNHRHERTFW